MYIYIYIYISSHSCLSVLCSLFNSLKLRTQSLIVVGRDLDEPFEIARHSANGTS